MFQLYTDEKKNLGGLGGIRLSTRELDGLSGSTPSYTDLGICVAVNFQTENA